MMKRYLTTAVVMGLLLACVTMDGEAKDAFPRRKRVTRLRLRPAKYQLSHRTYRRPVQRSDARLLKLAAQIQKSPLLVKPRATNDAPGIPPLPAGSKPQPEQSSPVIELYGNVLYDDRHNIHPCAVRVIVPVKDPRCCLRPCRCCAPGCVYVEICVPPCGCPKLEIKRRDYSKIEYDYGDYEVEITSRNGLVYVDYDD